MRPSELRRAPVLRSLARRALLTIRYEGIGAAVWRVIQLPLRWSPSSRRLGISHQLLDRRRRAAHQARRQRRPLRVVSPTAAPAGAAVDADLFVKHPATRASPHAVACLQYALSGGPGQVGVVGARLLSPSGTIAGAGLERDPNAPEGFTSCFAGRGADFPPAQVPHPVLAVQGEGMYVTRELIKRLGPPPGTLYGAVDYCLRAWECGYEVVYEPAAVLEPPEVGSSEPGEGTAFWDRWRAFFDGRSVRSGSEALRIVFVTEGTGLWGGHRVVFEDMQGLADRGHDVTLFTLGGQPDWTDLGIRVQTFDSYVELERALAPLDAIKVATWWRTALPVWRASVLRGRPVYFVQDIESSYYPEAEADRRSVLASYRGEFTYLTTSSWNCARLAELGHEAAVIPPALDAGRFRPSSELRQEDMIVALARSEHLKRFDLTVAAWQALPEPRPKLCLFGGEPGLAPPGAHHLGRLTDEEVNQLFGRCTVFVQTSAHEGFSLPPLEAMATGAAVVCTDADGNRDYCVDNVNCLMPEADPAAIAHALTRLLRDRALRQRLGAAGIETARRYDTRKRADAVERFMTSVAGST